MRLTLRTLLAYMDGLLDAKDSQEIGKKIEDSKYATDLFHKIRDVMRRLRLAAPSITERGANLDCNTVAEYLDNALPGDRVPDFEEVSLKSDVHLAEVASCHQILTMVLGEPAEIDPESRQRMYQLPTVANRVDEERLAAAEAASMLSGDGSAAAAPAPPAKVRPRPVVPEYLRDPPKKSRLLPAAAIMFLVSAAIGLLVVTVFPGARQWLQAKLPGNAAVDEPRDEGDTRKPAKPPEESAAGAKDSGNLLAASGKSEVPVPTADNTSAKPAAKNPPVVIPGKAPETSSGKAPETAVGPSLSGGTASSPAGVATAPTPETRPAAADKSAVASVAGPGLKGAEPPSLPGGPTLAAPPAKPLTAKIDSSLPSKPGVAQPAVGRETPPPSAQDKLKIGHFTSDGQDVLLKFEANNSGWRRVLPEEFLAAHQPLLALPSYRSRVVVLNVNATLELINGTRIELLSDDAHDPEDRVPQPGVDIDFGRVVITPSAQVARLRVVVGSHTGTITLTSVESIAALEVTRVHDPGTDPEKVFSHALARLYVARGGALWDEGEGREPVRLTAPAELMLEGVKADTPPRAGKDVPKWITANTVNELDQRAAHFVSQNLPADRPASRGLLELTEARLPENRWLAARCLGYLGQFDPMTAALNDLAFRGEWLDYVDQLKEAIARGPETAAGIRQSLERQYGNDSALLYRMLWGYTDKDLETGEDSRLVKFLDHESPVFRVLASRNLWDITQKTLGYRPEFSAAKRLAPVQQWRRQLQAGRIRFNVPEVKPRTAPAELPPKETIPAPPKPMVPAGPAEVQPTSATEPIAPGPTLPGNPLRSESSAVGIRSSERLPVSVPEPDPPERRPRIAFPEPRPAE